MSILEPNASIAEHYENMLFTMTDNTLHMGSIVYQDDNEVIIQDSALGEEVKLPIGNIQSKQSVPSLMPAGLADQLKSREEFLDLAKFLSVLGDPGPFQNDERPFIRKWRVSSVTGSHLPKGSESWKPAYSKVNGELPASDLALGERVFAKGFVDVQTPGSIRLDINHREGLSLWVDGKEVSDFEKPIELNEGRKEFTFRLDQSKRSDLGLRVLLETANGSPIKFRIEGGI